MKFEAGTDIPDLSEKIIIVTGGTDGLGKASVIELAKHKPRKIYLAARSKAKADTVITEIQTSVGATCAPIEFLELDLASLSSVQAAAKSFQASETRLDILLSNAGIMGGVKGTTKEGYEPMFGVNHVGTTLFIKLLLPVLEATAKLPNVQPGDTRAVILSSEAEAWGAKRVKTEYPFDQLKTAMTGSSTMTRYGISKLANVHTTRALSQRHAETRTGVRFVCVHPGGVHTNLGSDALGEWKRLASALKKVIGLVIGMVSVEEGAKNQLWACTWPSVKEGAPVDGAFYHPVALAGKGSKVSQDDALASKLWEWTEKELEPWMS